VMAHTESRNDIAICTYYMALAYWELGQRQEGRRLLDKATDEHPKCVVKDRVTSLFWGKA
jgi:hypothetical protein